MRDGLTCLRLVAALCSLGVAVAQFEVASLTGTVADPSGAVLPRATVTATNMATNTSATAVTNDEGRYLFPSLRPGTYSVKTSLAGFKQAVSSGIVLQVNQSGRFDVVLTVGDVSESVTVAAEASQLDTESGSRGAVIDQRKIIELPLNGRDYNQLALLSPGVLGGTPRLQSIGFKGAFNVNGNRAFHNAFQLDGVDNTSYSNSFRGNNMQVIQPSIEALQEFKIQTNAYSAEFGRSAGALINAVIRSGSNELHGSLFHFHRNDNFDANNFFANRAGLAKPFRLRNQFGGAAGGPIIKNKTFIFGDYEGLRDRAGTVRLTSVPQTIWRQGLFARAIHNPFNPTDTGQDFRIPATGACNDGSGNCWRIPANLIDPVGQRVLNVMPDPNTGAPGQIDNNFVNVPVDRTTTDQFDVRVDHYVSQALNIFGRYSFSDTSLFRPAPRPGLAEASFNDTFGTADWRSQALALGGTWVPRSNLVAETRFGWTKGDFFQLPPNFGTPCPGELIGLKNAPTEPSICGGLPVFNFPGGISRRIGRTTSVPQFQTPRGYNFRQSIAWIKSAHSVKFGGEYLRVKTGVRDVSSLLGNFDLNGRFTGGNGVWENALADLLLGFPARYQQDSDTTFNLYQNMYFLFLQDDWKLTSRLTLNYGVRYEFATPMRERDLQWSNFDPASRAYINAKSGSLYDEALVQPDRNNFAPRVGLSYAATSRTVVRAGYGMFFNHTNRQGREGLLGFNPPFIVLADAQIAGSNNLKSTDAFMRLQDGIPAGFVDIRRVNLATVARRGQDPFQRTSYTQQWNFGIQQALAKDLVLDVSYVGNRGLKLAAFRNLNQLPVTFNAQGAPVAGARPLAPVSLSGDIQYLENIGRSNYHSLQWKLEKRFSQGFTLLTAYTWGKALTDAVDHLSTSGAGNGVDVGVFRTPQNGLNRFAEYGLAEFDVKQRFVLSGVWQLPFGRGKAFGASWSKAADLVLGGWEFSPIVSVQGGLGLTITQAQILNLGGERQSRPNRIANGTLPSGQRTVDRWFDTSAFPILQTNPALAGFVANQAFGNSGVGILRGPNMVNVDFNLSKVFAITERQSVQLRCESFNAFNHSNFGVPGVNAAGGFGAIVNANDGRIIQFALKYRF